MLKKRLGIASLALALFATLAPVPSQASPRGWAAASELAAEGFVVKIERWWNLLLNGAERPAGKQPVPTQQKNGCGIDPNGGAGCGSGPGDGLMADPGNPTDSGGN